MRPSRLKLVGCGAILAACLVLLVSSFINWRTPAWGILIWGHRTDVFLGALGLALMGISLVVFSIRGRTWLGGLFAGLLLAASSILFGLSLVEWYLRDPARFPLRVPPEVLAVERRLVEPGVGLRSPSHPGLHRAVVPLGNIPLTWKDPRLAAQERREVEYYMDELGFTNRAVPDSADVIVIGDSFTQVADVPWEARWVSITQRTTGLTVYDISHGGYCPSQEVELYARYGGISGVRLVLLGIYGINDLSGERDFAHFVESGLGPKEWAYDKARKVLPKPTFGFIQVARRWRAEHSQARPRSTELEPITVANTVPPTLVSYYPNYQVRAWECVYLDPGQSVGVQSLEASIARLSALCGAQGRKAGVLYFPIKQTIHPPDPDDQEPWIAFLRRTLPWIESEGWDREITVMAGRLLLQGDRRLEAHLSAVCDSLGVPFHSTIPALEREAQTSHELTYYRFDTHWNARGNAAVGRDVAAWIHGIWEG